MFLCLSISIYTWRRTANKSVQKYLCNMWNIFFTYTTLECKGSGLIFFDNHLLSTWSLFLSCYIDLSKLIHGCLKVFTWIFQTWYCISQNCYMDLSKLSHGLLKLLLGFVKVCLFIFLALCQTKPSRSLAKISKLVEASALN